MFSDSRTIETPPDGTPNHGTMTDGIDAERLELTDSELIELLKNHGMNRRLLMRLFGAGVVVSALGGRAAGSGPGGANIDETYGATYFRGEKVPPGLVDHVVELHEHEPPGDHPDFPLVDSPEDGDSEPDTEESEFFFDPVGLHVEPGDVVQFEVHGPVTHTVTSFHPYYEGLPKRVPTADPYTSPPVAAAEPENGAEEGPSDSWLYRFDAEGVHDIVCLPHLPLGMVMRIVVFDPKKGSLDDISDYEDLPPAPVFANASAVLGAPEIDDPDAIVDDPDGAVAWAELTL